MKTVWTEQRLQRLFARYNRRFWQGRLASVQVHIADLDGLYGLYELYERKQRKITVNIGLLPDDREIRATLLHEMAHVAARAAGHGSEFWSQIERLLRQNAPITVGFPETPGLTILKDVVPRRFPLARRMANRAEARRGRAVEKIATGQGLTKHRVTDGEIVRDFEDAAISLKWREALFAVGIENGLVNVDGKPKNRWAANVIAKGRKAHARARRQLQQDRKHQLQMDSAVSD
jgi:hypothetical protein